ncbi:hypothetical protein BCV71DRAFT_236611 [Rhizopus microsporus]|uniref:Uncharacterized protein n=1 Tax=Rhizopus microsporus TaxID=58291 RepID=A0A1X0RX00_RHIZD|nr:hypothetical protein BCV71DRAFT_236611 [Rhizopus microsporus]
MYHSSNSSDQIDLGVLPLIPTYSHNLQAKHCINTWAIIPSLRLLSTAHLTVASLLVDSAYGTCQTCRKQVVATRRRRRTERGEGSDVCTTPRGRPCRPCPCYFYSRNIEKKRETRSGIVVTVDEFRTSKICNSCNKIVFTATSLDFHSVLRGCDKLQ